MEQSRRPMPGILWLILAVLLVAQVMVTPVYGQTLTLPATAPDSMTVGSNYIVRPIARTVTGSRVSSVSRVQAFTTRPDVLEVVYASGGQQYIAKSAGTAIVHWQWQRTDKRVIRLVDTVKVSEKVVLPPLPPDTVTSPPISGPARLPELPRVTPEAVVPTVTGRRIEPLTADELQAALDTARAGDEIVLAPGATYLRHGFSYRTTLDTGYVLLRTGTAVPDGRVTPTTSITFALLSNTVPSEPALVVAKGAAGLYVLGVKIANDTTRTNTTIVQIGSSGSDQTLAEQAPDRIIFDRVHVYGGSDNNVQRCFAVHTRTFVLANSWVADCHAFGYDAQAVWIMNGPGPYRLHNNFLEGSGENVMTCGADPRTRELLPSDITIDRNHFYKPRTPRWLPNREDVLPQNYPSFVGNLVFESDSILASPDDERFSNKVLLEFKCGDRIFVHENVFQNSWPDGQTGGAWNFKSTNQSGRLGVSEWIVTQNVTATWNYVFGVEMALSLSGAPEKPAVKANTFLFENNLWQTTRSRMLQISDVSDITFRRNTGLGTYQSVVAAGSPLTRLTMTENLFRGGSYAFAGLTNTNITTFAPGASINNNVFATSQRGDGLISGNTFPGLLPYPQTAEELDALAARFPNVGVDLSELRARLVGVVVAP